MSSPQPDHEAAAWAALGEVTVIGSNPRQDDLGAAVADLVTNRATPPAREADPAVLDALRRQGRRAADQPQLVVTVDFVALVGLVGLDAALDAVAAIDRLEAP